LREALRYRDFRLLLAGQTLSMFGDTALFLALGVWVKQLTGSNGAAGAVFLVLAMPYVFAPFGGLLVDRVRRRPLMIGVDLSTAAVVLLLFFVHGRGDVWIIYAVAALYGASQLVFESARSALVFTLLPAELLDAGNSGLTTIRQGLRLVGPLVGVGLYARFGGGVTAALDAATFVASAAALLAMRLREERPAPTQHRIRHELAAGVRHLASVSALRRLVLALAAAMTVVGFSESAIFAIVQHGLDRPATFLGVVEVIQGVGAIGGGLTATWISRTLGETRLVGVGLLTAAAGSALAAGSGMALVFPGVILFGASLPWIIVGFNTALQRGTPGPLQGRAYSAADMAFSIPQTVSIGLGAVLISVVDYRLLLAAMALVLACSAASLRSVRTAPVVAESLP
jgi:Na+/melibiose symporter-like transporter